MKAKHFVVPQNRNTFVIEVSQNTPKRQEIPYNFAWNRVYVRNDTDYTLYFFREYRNRLHLLGNVENGTHQLLSLPQPISPYEHLVIDREPSYIPNSPSIIELDFTQSRNPKNYDQSLSNLAKFLRSELETMPNVELRVTDGVLEYYDEDNGEWKNL